MKLKFFYSLLAVLFMTTISLTNKESTKLAGIATFASTNSSEGDEPCLTEEEIEDRYTERVFEYYAIFQVQ